jgi:murein DD-endopeptidase MepM/ murein hydrolase activator NlpD
MDAATPEPYTISHSADTAARPRRWLRRILIALAPGILALAVGLLWPERMTIPVQGATGADWNHDTFWYYPWGRSVVHKGIDIFAPEGTAVLSATDGIVTHVGRRSRGGNVVVILGPRWHVHYYAHLRTIAVRPGAIVSRGQPVATVGRTGNAAGTPPHLHYSIVTLIPLPWRADSSPQGYLKVFFLDPGRRLLQASDE